MRQAMGALVEGLGGHAWTVLSHLRDVVRPPPPPPAVRWQTELVDPQVGSIRLSGLIDHVPSARRILLVLHGMGGSADRAYCAHAAAAARAEGMSSLRLNLRGADGSGEDIYHIGMVDDLAAALASPEVARYDQIVALGYSLGGHVALRFAALAGARGGVRAVAAVCAPLDLAAGVAHIDHPLRWPYRRHLLDGVKEVYRQVAARRAMPLATGAMLAIRTLREWDDKVVAPPLRFRRRRRLLPPGRGRSAAPRPRAAGPVRGRRRRPDDPGLDPASVARARVLHRRDPLDPHGWTSRISW
jgi:predicted alpha/beta-fold hydrolase